MAYVGKGMSFDLFNKIKVLLRRGRKIKMKHGGSTVCRAWAKQFVAGSFTKDKIQMNYTELTQAIQDYTENTETSFVANIPTFVRQAEEKILRQVLIPELRKASTGATLANSQYLARPTDMIAVYSIALEDADGNWAYLLNKNVTFIKEAFPASKVSTPRYYAQFVGGTTLTPGFFILGPTPDQAYLAQINYYYDPPSIVTAGTTWLGDNAETALLYGHY